MAVAAQRPPLPHLDLSFMDSPKFRPRPQAAGLELASMMSTPVKVRTSEEIRRSNRPRIKATQWAPANLPAFQSTPSLESEPTRVDLQPHQSGAEEFSIIELPSTALTADLWSGPEERDSWSIESHPRSGLDAVQKARTGKGKSFSTWRLVKNLAASTVVVLMIAGVIVLALRLTRSSS